MPPLTGNYVPYNQTVRFMIHSVSTRGKGVGDGRTSKLVARPTQPLTAACVSSETPAERGLQPFATPYVRCVCI